MAGPGGHAAHEGSFGTVATPYALRTLYALHLLTLLLSAASEAQKHNMVMQV